jgi:peptide/nickel transport system substrate-binding protein
MRCTRLRWLAGISALAVALMAAGPERTAATKRPRYGGTLRVQLRGASLSLDPREWKAGSVAAADSERLGPLVYDRLVTLDEYGRFQPGLATEWSHDGATKNWQFKIRSGVKFSDGMALTAKDVVSALQPLLPAGLTITSVENGVTIRSQRALPDLLEQLASGRYFVFRVLGGNAGLLGTGPFVLAESTPPMPSEANPSVLKPARMKFRANEECWAGRPFLDAIELTLGDPPLRQIMNLQVGRAEVIDIPPDLVRKARQENLRVWSSPPETLLALRFDDAQASTTDARLREALDLALDRETMANVLLQRQAQPAAGLLPQWLSGYAFLFGGAMNLERAKELRAAFPVNVAGGTEPLRMRVDAVGDLMKLLGERVAVNARQANLSVQLVPHAGSGGGAAATPSPAAGLRLFAWHYDSLSPRVELQEIAQYLHAESGTETASESPNPEKLFADELHLLETRQVLPLVVLPEYVGIATNVRNWSAAPSGEWRLADVWLDTVEATASNGEGSGEANGARGVHP